jgi:hypothetical protein
VCSCISGYSGVIVKKILMNGGICLCQLNVTA